MIQCAGFLLVASERTIVARREGNDQRDDLPANNGGDLPFVGKVSAERRELQPGDVGECAVCECADGQAGDDDQWQTEPRGQPGRRRQWCLGGVHDGGGGGRIGSKVACFDFGAELIVWSKGKERNVGCHKGREEFFVVFLRARVGPVNRVRWADGDGGGGEVKN